MPVDALITGLITGLIIYLIWTKTSYVGKLEEKILKLEKENREYLNIIYSENEYSQN